MTRILITDNGGIAEVDQSTISEGIEVEIRDYAAIVSGLETKLNDDGDCYDETIWTRIE